MSSTLNPFCHLKSGEVIPNVRFWKYIQAVTNVIAILAPTFSIFFPGIELTDEQFSKIIVAIGGLNAYLTVSTTEKLGV